MINRVQERALRVILGDDLGDFESLLPNNRDIRSHHKISKAVWLRYLTLSWRRPLSYRNCKSMDWFLYDNGLHHEIVKIKNELAAPIMDSIFERRNEPYNPLNFQEFLTEKKELCIMILRQLSVSTIVACSTRKH